MATTSGDQVLDYFTKQKLAICHALAYIQAVNKWIYFLVFESSRVRNLGIGIWNMENGTRKRRSRK
jgi:hypothetical protein